MSEDIHAASGLGEQHDAGNAPGAAPSADPEQAAGWQRRTPRRGLPPPRPPQAAAQPPEPEPPPRRSRSRKWVWVAVTAALALTAFGAGALSKGLLGKKHAQTPVATHRQTRTPSHAPSPATLPSSPQLVIPAPGSAGGLVRDAAAEQAAGSSLSNMLDALAVQANTSSPGVTAVYRQPGTKDPDSGGQKRVNYVGLNVGLADPASFLSTYLHNATNGLSDTRFVTVSPGNRGGRAQCVTFSNSSTGDWTLCGWATKTTVGIVDTPLRDSSAGELAATMRQMRQDLERG